jgi:hypothetical protein
MGASGGLFFFEIRWALLFVSEHSLLRGLVQLVLDARLGAATEEEAAVEAETLTRKAAAARAKELRRRAEASAGQSAKSRRHAICSVGSADPLPVWAAATATTASKGVAISSVSTCTATPTVYPRNVPAAQQTERINPPSPPPLSTSRSTSSVAPATPGSGDQDASHSLERSFTSRIMSAIDALLTGDGSFDSSSAAKKGTVRQASAAPGSADDRRITSRIRSGINMRALLRGYNNAVCGIMDRLLQVGRGRGPWGEEGCKECSSS